MMPKFFVAELALIACSIAACFTLAVNEVVEEYGPSANKMVGESKTQVAVGGLTMWSIRTPTRFVVSSIILSASFVLVVDSLSTGI